MLILQTPPRPDEIAGVPYWFFLVAVTALGAIIGSFLNVVIHRVPLEESVVFPNSRCPSCGTAIRPYDNLPVVSWAVLRGRCRSCRAPISARYPAVELLTAVLFAVTYLLHSGLTLSLPFDLAFVAALVALVFIDAEHMILPDVITLPGALFALAARAAVPNLYGVGFVAAEYPQLPPWAVSLVGAVIGAAAGGVLGAIIGNKVDVKRAP